MTKKDVVQSVQLISKATVAFGTGIIDGCILRLILPRELKAPARIAACIGISTVAYAAEEHLGVYKLVDEMAEDAVNMVDDGLKRLGYVREEY